jgi:hypothetical protein
LRQAQVIIAPCMINSWPDKASRTGSSTISASGSIQAVAG